jgi:hypothetical protein
MQVVFERVVPDPQRVVRARRQACDLDPERNEVALPVERLVAIERARDPCASGAITNPAGAVLARLDLRPRSAPHPLRTGELRSCKHDRHHARPKQQLARSPRSYVHFLALCQPVCQRAQHGGATMVIRASSPAGHQRSRVSARPHDPSRVMAQPAPHRRPRRDTDHEQNEREPQRPRNRRAWPRRVA